MIVALFQLRFALKSLWISIYFMWILLDVLQVACNFTGPRRFSNALAQLWNLESRTTCGNATSKKLRREISALPTKFPLSERTTEEVVSGRLDKLLSVAFEPLCRFFSVKLRNGNVYQKSERARTHIYIHICIHSYIDTFFQKLYCAEIVQIWYLTIIFISIFYDKKVS